MSRSLALPNAGFTGSSLPTSFTALTALKYVLLSAAVLPKGTVGMVATGDGWLLRAVQVPRRVCAGTVTFCAPVGSVPCRCSYVLISTSSMSMCKIRVHARGVTTLVLNNPSSSKLTRGDHDN